MPKKINEVVTSSGAAASVSQATSMADGKSYIRNPKNHTQILQIQSKEGSVYKCFLVTRKEGSAVTVDSTNAIYVNQDYESNMERI